MSKVYTSVTELIGRTPLIELVNIEKKYDLKAKVVAKLELFNPAGSVKDRVAKAMVEDAEKSGKLKKGSTIIEPTSGNTGIGLASVATAKGYKTILTMPETMSVERRNLLKAYGAEIVLTDGTKGMSGAIAKAKELEKEIDGGIILGQFENPANPKAHFDTTGPEIWEDTDGNVVTSSSQRRLMYRLLQLSHRLLPYFRKVTAVLIRFRVSAQALFPILSIQRYMTKFFRLLTKPLSQMQMILQRQKVSS